MNRPNTFQFSKYPYFLKLETLIGEGSDLQIFGWLKFYVCCKRKWTLKYKSNTVSTKAIPTKNELLIRFEQIDTTNVLNS